MSDDVSVGRILTRLISNAKIIVVVIILPKTGNLLALEQPSIIIPIMPVHILGFLFLLNIFFFCTFQHVLAVFEGPST